MGIHQPLYTHVQPRQVGDPPLTQGVNGRQLGHQRPIAQYVDVQQFDGADRSGRQAAVARVVGRVAQLDRAAVGSASSASASTSAVARSR